MQVGKRSAPATRDMTRSSRRILALASSLVATMAATAQPFIPSARLSAKADPWVINKLTDKQSTDLLVVLPQQADVSAASRFRDKTERGRYVYETLRAHAERAQGGLRSWLTQRGVAHRAFWISNMIVVRDVDAATAEALAARTDVAKLAANPVVKLSRPQTEATTAAAVPDAVQAVAAGVQRINAPAMWALGYTGQGIVIGGQDTGYRWTHNALIGKYRGWNGNTANHNYNWHDSIHAAIGGGMGGGTCGLNALAPCDDNGHGTHTMGTMAGDDGGANQIGVAPGAKWIGCRNMDRGNGTPDTYIECFEWFVAPTDVTEANPDSSKAPHVINNSWGCPPSEGCTDPNVMRTVVENVQAAGILVVVSAGNEGSGCSSVQDPAAIYDASFSVGAVESTADAIASFSSRGPVMIDGSGRLKPDVSAPGVSVLSSTSTSNASYGNSNGTSMAGPHVAGAAALLMSAHPQLIGNPDAVKRLLMRTAVRRTTATNCGNVATTVPNNTYGWGRIDVLAAHNGAPGATLDIDASATATRYDAATDGVMVLRHLFGVGGNGLTDSALGGTATRNTPAAVKTELNRMQTAVDVDGNTRADATTDGLLILRYLLGLRGTALITSAVGSGATRTSAADIEAYLRLLTP